MLRSPAPALVVATPAAVGEEVAAGAPGARARVDEDGDGARRAVRGAGQGAAGLTGSQVETGAPLVRLEPVGDGDDGDGRGRRGRRRPRPARAATPATAMRPRGPPRRSPTCPRCCSASTSTRATTAGRSPRYLDRARRARRRRARRCWTARSALLEVFADFAELSRNRPAGEELHTEYRVHSPREHFHTYLQSLDAERGGAARPSSAPSSPGCCGHYGVDDLDRTPDLEEAVFRVFLAQQRSAPDVAARRPRCCSAGSPSRRPTAPLRRRPPATCWTGSSVATQLRFPVDRRPGPQRPVPVVRPAAGRRRPRERARRGRATSSRRSRRDPDGRTDAGARIDALAAIPEQIVRFLAERLEDGDPRRRADARGADPAALPRVRPARPARAATSAGGRSPSPTTPLDEPPTQLCRPSVGVDELTRRRARSSRPSTTELGQRADGSRGRRRPLPVLAGRAGRPGRGVRRARASVWPSCRSPSDVRRVAVAVCPGGGRPVGYFTFRPDGDGGRSVEDATGPRRAPDGRAAAQPVAAARVRRHPAGRARGRAALRLRRAGQPGRPAAGRAGPGAPARRRPRRATAGSSACRTPSARSRTAWRRSAAPAPRAAPPAPGST